MTNKQLEAKRKEFKEVVVLAIKAVADEDYVFFGEPMKCKKNISGVAIEWLNRQINNYD